MLGSQAFASLEWESDIKGMKLDECMRTNRLIEGICDVVVLFLVQLVQNLTAVL